MAPGRTGKDFKPSSSKYAPTCVDIGSTTMLSLSSTHTVRTRTVRTRTVQKDALATSYFEVVFPA
eukprot:8288755-Pyramimonas_sp.AAC.1